MRTVGRTVRVRAAYSIINVHDDGHIAVRLVETDRLVYCLVMCALNTK
jgi:hypothetical protein